MAVVPLNTNIASLKAQGQFARTTEELSSTFERLSSGLRITRPGDDAAGLAIAADLNVDARVFVQGVRNVNDGISYLTIAEESIGSMKEILFRLRELATQASNGTLSNTQRSALDAEAQALIREHNRILESTSFNDIAVFAGGSASQLRVQAGYSSVMADLAGLVITVGDGTFQARTSYVTGTTPVDVALGDLNGDGNLDIVHTERSAGGHALAVRLGNGDGTFRARITYAAGTDPSGVAVADFNGDGQLDAVSNDYTSRTLSVYIGNGDGTFKARVTYAIGVNSQIVLVDDFNGDGKLDVVNSDIADNTLSVTLGNGDGTFKARSTHVTGGNPIGVAVADFNADGKRDLVNVDFGSSTLSVSLGNGDGTFKARTAYTTDGSPAGVTVGDFNGDGRQDLANTDSGTNTLSIHLGNGDGSFKARTSYATGTNPGNESMAEPQDFNADGNLDLVNPDLGSNSLSIYFGNGDGTFRARVSYASGGGPRSVAVGDLNGDDVLDLVNTDLSGNTLSVFLGNGVETTVTLQTITDISVATQTAALAAHETLDEYLSQANTVAGIIGASVSRFQVAVQNLQQTTENYRAAESRIVDADAAEETAKLTRQRILQQAGAAVLSQANQQPELALRLLGVGA